jgi:hypothetical protein
LEALYSAQAERRAANTAMSQASASAAAAADKKASSVSPTCFSPTAEMDSIASPPPTSASTDCPSGASIADEDLTGSLASLVYIKDFYLEQNRSVRALVVLYHGLMRYDGIPATNLLTAPWSMINRRLLAAGTSCAPMIPPKGQLYVGHAPY